MTLQQQEKFEMNVGWTGAEATESHAYLLPAVIRALEARHPAARGNRVIDVGCGNGVISAAIRAAGYDVVGVEPSADGVRQARNAFPSLVVEQASAYDDLPTRFGQFDCVVCLEVVEHLYSPRVFAENVFRLLKPEGLLIISTPYHGYLKNLALALANKWDFHHHPLVEHGHIKFWSRVTLERLLRDAGLDTIEFHLLGRIPALAKSMMLVARKSSHLAL